MKGRIIVLPAGESNAQQSLGYGGLTNFVIVLTGRDVIAITALGVVALVALLMIFTRSGRKSHKEHYQSISFGAG